MLGADGKPVTVTMGSYGIGVSRAVAAIAEMTTTSSACAGRARSPRPTSTSSSPASPAASSGRPPSSLAADLEAAGVRVLLDDRDSVSPGVKFKDAELIGIPTIVVVGRGLADGTIEVKDRRTATGSRPTSSLAVGHARRAGHDRTQL